MNERIRLLAEQAGLLPKEIGPVVETRHMKNKQQDLAKFAELIVQECVQVSGPEDSYTDEWFKAKADSVAKIKEHFGVEPTKLEKFSRAMEKAFEGGVDLSGRETP